MYLPPLTLSTRYLPPTHYSNPGTYQPSLHYYCTYTLKLNPWYLTTLTHTTLPLVPYHPHTTLPLVPYHPHTTLLYPWYLTTLTLHYPLVPYHPHTTLPLVPYHPHTTTLVPYHLHTLPWYLTTLTLLYPWYLTTLTLHLSYTSPTLPLVPYHPHTTLTPGTYHPHTHLPLVPYHPHTTLPLVTLPPSHTLLYPWYLTTLTLLYPWYLTTLTLLYPWYLTTPPHYSTLVPYHPHTTLPLVPYHPHTYSTPDCCGGSETERGTEELELRHTALDCCGGSETEREQFHDSLDTRDQGGDQGGDQGRHQGCVNENKVEVGSDEGKGPSLIPQTSGSPLDNGSKENWGSLTPNTLRDHHRAEREEGGEEEWRRGEAEAVTDWRSDCDSCDRAQSRPEEEKGAPLSCGTELEETDREGSTISVTQGSTQGTEQQNQEGEEEEQQNQEGEEEEQQNEEGEEEEQQNQEGEEEEQQNQEGEEEEQQNQEGEEEEQQNQEGEEEEQQNQEGEEEEQQNQEGEEEEQQNQEGEEEDQQNQEGEEEEQQNQEGEEEEQQNQEGEEEEQQNQEGEEEEQQNQEGEEKSTVGREEEEEEHEGHRDPSVLSGDTATTEDMGHTQSLEDLANSDPSDTDLKECLQEGKSHVERDADSCQEGCHTLHPEDQPTDSEWLTTTDSIPTTKGLSDSDPSPLSDPSILDNGQDIQQGPADSGRSCPTIEIEGLSEGEPPLEQRKKTASARAGEGSGGSTEEEFHPSEPGSHGTQGNWTPFWGL
ncbi:unnamed protein product [Coregonus sp. 'balchen']|nr:unnamed protein product [Coregonus sp. 'balchen']